MLDPRLRNAVFKLGLKAAGAFILLVQMLPALAQEASIKTASVAESPDLPKKISFQNILKNKDIAIGEVEVVMQDHEGYIWFGGRNALLRYDGYEFLTLYIAPTEGSDEIKPATHVVDLFEDSRQRIWAGTRTGVIYFDREQQIFHRLETRGNDKVHAVYDTINSLHEAPTGEILVGTYEGLNVIDPHSLDISIIDADPSNPAALNNPVIRDILPVHDGQHLWLATDKGISLMHWGEKRVTNYVPYPKEPDALPYNSIWVMAKGTDEELWLGAHQGVYRFNPETGVFKHYEHNAEDPFSLSANLTRNILTDSRGFTWIGSDGGGLNLYDAKNDRFLNFRHKDGQSNSLTSNSIRALFEDKAGDLWVGTYPDGMNFYDRSSGAITSYRKDASDPNSLPHNSVLTVQEDTQGNLWLGTDGGGAAYFDRFSGQIKHYTAEQGHLGSNAILSSLIDSKGNYWVGTWGAAVNKYNPTTDTFEQIPFDKNLKGKGSGEYQFINDEAIWSIKEDRQGTLWIGTHGGGLNRYNPETETFTVFAHDAKDDSTIANQLVWTTFEDSHNNFWVGTANGLSLFDRATGLAKNFTHSEAAGSLSNNSVLSIYEDKTGRLWFGSDEGLNLYQTKTQTFKVYGKKDGFIDEGIRSITEDATGNLWLSTNNGIISFNPDSLSVKNFKRASGENMGGFNTGSSLFSQQGEAIFGGSNGLRIFKIDQLGVNQAIPPIALTNFKVFTKKVPINGPDGLLAKEINQTQTITLDYKKNMFSFDFAALNFRDSDKNSYAYKLDGFDKEWREVGSKRTALYTNLDSGTYTFMVKGSNNDGLWNEDAKTITIIQLPPPWKTWWAYTIYTFIILGLIAKLIHRQHEKRRQIEEQNRILEAKVAERTGELAAKNKDIQAMLSNMRQGLFTVKDDGKIHPEYSAYLEDIFKTKDIAEQEATALLFDRSDIGADDLNQAIEGIKSILGEDEMNFTFNSHVLPSDYAINDGDEQKYLSLVWDPILNSADEVEKLMVSVRDVTKLREAEAEAESQKRELDIIAQLISVPEKKYQSFEESTTNFIDENRAKISASKGLDPEVIALLFRNMHTIKGNCRTYGFSYLSDVVHNVETVYSDLKKAKSGAWNPQELLTDLDRVEQTAAEYNKVYHDVLGRGDSNQQSTALDSHSLESIQTFIRKTVESHPETQTITELQSAKMLVDIALSEPTSKVLEDIIASLPSIAEQLDKEPPVVTIDDSNIRINTPAHELLNNVFAHVLRNSVDHGLEPSDEREQHGKPPVGTIDVKCELTDRGLRLRVKDDGRGVNIKRLLDKGREMGCWQEQETPDTQTIANLIFASGASTKDEVTAISGRGVGMDAVKQFLQNAGGDIQLHLLTEYSTDSDFVPFETHITLPSNCYSEIRYIP